MQEATLKPSCCGSGPKTGVWDESNIGSFIPERWLDKDRRFNKQAGPVSLHALRVIKISRP